MTLNQQAETFLRQISSRKRGPARKATILSFRNRLDSIILPKLGWMDLKDIDNKALKQFVSDISGKFAPTTITHNLSLIKQIVASALDENGNPLYPRTWNSDFIDAPLVEKKALRTPTVVGKQVSEALGRTQSTGLVSTCLHALLAGTGLRIGEALALRWDEWKQDDGFLCVNSTLLQDGTIQNCPKTEAGIRQVDLHPSLNEFLKDKMVYGKWLFGVEKPLSYITALRHLRDTGIEGFHSFRRFRRTHLETSGVPDGLANYWMGHSTPGMAGRYIKVAGDFKIRKEWCEKIGLGFEL